MYVDGISKLQGVSYPVEKEYEDDVNCLVRHFEAVNTERDLLYRDSAFLNITNEQITTLIEQLNSLCIDVMHRCGNYNKLGEDE
jgi:hypothetical protein